MFYKSRHRRNFMALVLTWIIAILIVFTSALPVAAADSPNSSKLYTIRVYTGQRGVFEDGSDVKEWKYPAGHQFDDFHTGDVILNGKKYYVKGIRESGKDFKENKPSFIVDRDIDYVVSYGILGVSIPYTVRYLDEDGNEILPSETYYGNVGDQPVIAYHYVEGWSPQAYNITKTLSDNATDNVFRFVYTRAASSSGYANEESVGSDMNTSATGSSVNGTNGNGSEEFSNEVIATDEATPQELLNLDDEETPLYNIKNKLKDILVIKGNGTLINSKLLIVIIPCTIFFIFLLIMCRKKKSR